MWCFVSFYALIVHRAGASKINCFKAVISLQLIQPFESKGSIEKVNWGSALKCRIKRKKEK